MYIVTFYSFKGGVGRSMSLVNVGVQLAQSGKKVLLVDFDLEAPGLSTFNLSKPNNDTPGLVDFVTDYLNTSEAPDVKNYIYESTQFESGGRIFVMNAGVQNENYSQKLNAIDWNKLYAEQSGYLLFEDLKRQWDKTVKPDYVLIDSRTGHSDVEGICTRQLADAVCLLFFPNEQNLNGLKKIVSTIKVENNKRSNNQIQMHFAFSNVPDLDDEYQILTKTMERFEKELGYNQLASVIHHYNSLSLLNQEIFSLERPNSRLAKEYAELTKAITKFNFSDRNAVFEYLKQTSRYLDEDGNVEFAIEELDEKIQTILNNFKTDGEVYYRASIVREKSGNPQEALDLLSTDVVETGFSTATMYASRANLNYTLGNNEEAISDLKLMLNSAGFDHVSLLKVRSIIDSIAPELYLSLPNSKAIYSLPRKDRIRTVLWLDNSTDQIRAAIEILNNLKNENLDKEELSFVDHRLPIYLMGIGNFNEALNLFENKDLEGISDYFNYGMASWGLHKKPNIEIFQKVRELNEEIQTKDANTNYIACMAIVYSVLGEVEKAKKYIVTARNTMKRSPRREFSPWAYKKVGSMEFIEHLNKIEKFICGENILPDFIAEASTAKTIN